MAVTERDVIVHDLLRMLSTLLSESQDAQMRYEISAALNHLTSASLSAYRVPDNLEQARMLAEAADELRNLSNRMQERGRNESAQKLADLTKKFHALAHAAPDRAAAGG